MILGVFRSRLLEENAAEFQALADEMMSIAEATPGFVSYRVYAAEDGERCSVVEFETREQLLAWRAHPRHQVAQNLGRERFYDSYVLQVGEPERESRFDRREATAQGAG